MKEPIVVRPLSDVKCNTFKADLRSPDAFVLCRCQILLANANRMNAYQIARIFGCHNQAVRNVIHKFNQDGLEATLKRGSRRPHTVHAAFGSEPAKKRLKEMLHQSPRNFGKSTSLWALNLVAEVNFEEGLAQRRVSGETIRATLTRMEVSWRRAKRWIATPYPEYRRKKGCATG